MLTIMTLAAVFLAVGFALAVFMVLVKLVLLPFKLALGLFKLAIAVTFGGVLLLLGLPILAVLALPFLILGALAWGVVRLAQA